MDAESLIEIITLEKENFNSTLNKIINIDSNALITQERIIKNVIAHTIWYAERIIEVISQDSSFKEYFNNLSLKERNNIIYKQNKDLKLE